jgi:RNA polymerase sigma factor (sigma-70 family)
MGEIPDRPGSEWTAEERQRVREWVCRPEQLDRLHAIEGAFLAEERRGEAWSAFLASGKIPEQGKDFPQSAFDRTIDRFEPSRGASFWSYLRMRFSWFCRDRLRSIRGRQARHDSLDDTDEETGESRIAAQASDDTFDQVHQREVRQAILDCWLELPSELHVIFALRYLWDGGAYISEDERSIRDIAQTLSTSESLAKVRLYRARLLMKDCLKKRDIEP